MVLRRNAGRASLSGIFPSAYHPAGLIILSFIIAWAAQWVVAIKGQAFTLAVGIILYAAAVVFFHAFKSLPGEKGPPPALSLRVEFWLITLIMLFAAAVRLWRLESFPPGLFADQGNQAYQALRILHEGYRPLFDHELLQTPALYLYELAAWFWLFGESELSSRVFFVAASLAAFPFFYWFYRQIAGPRLALLALFVLAVLRWHVNLSRWGCEGSLNFLFMGASLAFFLHGLHHAKKWALILSGLLLGVGMYYYASFYFFPLLVLIYILYEWKTNPERILKLNRLLLGMAAGFLAFMAPLALYAVINGGVMDRPVEVSLTAEIGKQKSFLPVWENLRGLALMFNRVGDSHPRHNFQSAPMLDGLTAALFILGLLIVWRERKRRMGFYILAALAVLCLPGFLSYPMPNALRMGGMTPFLALVAALPIGALLEPGPSISRRRKSLVVAIIGGIMLVALATQNIHAYFGPQMNDPVGWYWWDPVPTAIARRMKADGGKTDFIVTPRCTDNYTIRFIAYPFRENYKNFQTTDLVPVFPGKRGMGLEYVLEPQRDGTRGLIQKLFSQGRQEFTMDLIGNKVCYFYHVEAVALDKVLGLDCTLQPSGKKQHLADFPRGLPRGPFRAVLSGCVFLPDSGEYSLQVEGDSGVSIEIAGKEITSGKKFNAAAGYFGIRIILDTPAGPPQFGIVLQKPDGTSFPLDAGCLTTLPLNHGLLTTYDKPSLLSSSPDFQIWEQVIDFDHRCQYPFLSWVKVPAGGSLKWEGDLIIEQEGEYVLKTPEKIPAMMTVDDARYICQGTATATKVYLSRGSHSLKIELADPPDHFFLSWKRPGRDNFEVVPLEAFGTTKLL